MIKLGLVAAALLAATTIARAQPGADETPAIPQPSTAVDSEHGFLGGGVLVGGDHFFNEAWVIEGAVKLPALPLWVRGVAAFGNTGDFEGTGDFQRWLVGLEARRCPSSSGMCGFVGFDIGHQSQTWNRAGEPMEHHDGAVLGPRFGFDAGGEQLRFRLGFELYKYRRRTPGENPTWDGGGDVQITLAYRI